MTETKSTYEYQVGGSLDSHAPSYVTRQADLDFYQALKAGQFCYVLNSRQMGKSSLRVRTMQRLQTEGTVCVFIDLTGMGTQDVTPEKWYAGMVQSLVSSSDLTSKIQWRSWWRERRDLFSPVQLLSLFIKEILLVEIKQKIVIFVDEIDRVLSQNFSLDDFFGLILYCYDQRDTHVDYQRLTFTLLGVATPSDLIEDKTQTPFNIGQGIQLQGFQFDEVKPLIEGLRAKIDHPETIIKDILEWTGGQPFLTQKLCQLVMQSIETQQQTIETKKWPTSSSISLQEENIKFIEQVVRSHILENWEVKDEPEHLRTIRDRILRNEQKAVQLLGLYKKILEQGTICSDGSSEQMELRLSGLVVEKQGQIEVYNMIYKTIFDITWVEKNLEKLRPYSAAVNAWIASKKKNESCLLQGLELQNALTWALGKSLSDVDYQFLVASQELARQKTKTLLETTEKASQLLASARAQAKQKVQKRRIGRAWIPLTALSVTGMILLLRFSGLLQGLEWNLLDLFFRLRPLEAPDSRIAIITIDETDLREAKQGLIPDGILAEAITKIKAQNPQAIGLDIYRDLSVEPGHTDLVKVFQSTSNLFGIEKVIGNQVKPSPVLSQLGQVGFADQVLDTDGKVRRALLSVVLCEDEVRYSLGVMLALNYLEKEGITLEILENGQRVRLGKAVFQRFKDNDGGYIRTDSGGYQVLLNFRGTQADFLTFSLRDLLNNQIPPKSLRNRLVFLGTTAESMNDLFYTPYSYKGSMMPGIVLHANIASNILSSALDGRALLRVWSEPIEWLWISVIALIGAVISWWFQSMRGITLIWLVVISLLFGGCYFAFIFGWWLPFIPALLAFVAAGFVLVMIGYQQQEKLKFALTLALLLETYQDDPATGCIAIEYLKQSESKDNKAFIEKRLLEVLPTQETQPRC
ncbi:MAG: CHASE2 domain-containing protein [Crocosphaera sp.]|nr:CHASE2 domain-containing protein [Crocosphaera sp.]